METVTEEERMSKPRDFAYEALADVTGTDWTTGRGELNAALKSIREQSEIEDSYLLASEIIDRAKMYRVAMPDVILTPSALAKHYLRVRQEVERMSSSVPRNPPPPQPSRRDEENLEEVRKLKAALWGER
jgi:hypothetical protein